MPSWPEISTVIGGQSEPSGDRPAECPMLVDPNTGDPLAPNAACTPAQVDRAIASALAAHEDGRWRTVPVAARAQVLHRWADLLDAESERIAHLDALNSGVPLGVTRLFASSNAGTVREAARLARERGDATPLDAGERNVRVQRVPWGPTALIAPWNAPAAMATKKLAYALAAGATAVLKPAPFSPWSAQLVVETAVRAGVPDGVVSLVPGGAEIGSRLVADARIRAIAMTGSTPAGRAIAGIAAPRFARLRLELGSNNPAIVLPDADISTTASALVQGAMKMSGQWCEAPRRVFVSRGILDDLVDAMEGEMRTLVVGSSLDERTTLGPVAYEGRRVHLTGIRDDLTAQGARRRGSVGEERGGSFFAPTMMVGEDLTVTDEMFGPLLTVEPVDDVDHAVCRAHEGQTGLAAYVFSTDEDRAFAVGSRLIAGEVKINGTSVLDMAPGSAQSFFGDSGIGGHGDLDVLDFFAGKRVIGTDVSASPL